VQLDYKVLFVDDDGFDDYMGELRDVIKTHLEDKGFILQAIEVKTEEKLDSQILNDKDYDMIFVDNRFDDKECGLNFIKKIRDSNIYSDIILCTAQSDQELIKKIDAYTAVYGYYYIRKGPNLFQHIYNVIDFRFNKELDTNVMRGIAMSEVAKFDVEILNILLKNDDYKTDIIKKIKTTAENRNKETQSLPNDEIWKIVSNPDKSTLYFDSSLRKDFLNAHVLKKINMLKDCYNEIKKKYYVEILKKRNILAHKINPDLSEDEIRQFRKDLIKFKGIFSKINEYINQEPPHA